MKAKLEQQDQSIENLTKLTSQQQELLQNCEFTLDKLDSEKRLIEGQLEKKTNELKTLREKFIIQSEQAIKYLH